MSFFELEPEFGSHGQSVFDYEQDGDLDIISNDFGNTVSDAQPFILRNDGTNDFEIVKSPSNRLHTGRTLLLFTNVCIGFL